MCHTVCTNLAGITVARLFLSVTEAALAPGFLPVTSMFYTRRKQPLRHEIWFMGN